MPLSTINSKLDTLFDPTTLPSLARHDAIFRRFLMFLTLDVQRKQLTDTRIEVRETVDPEEDTTQVLVQLWLSNFSEQQVRECHRAFGRQVDEWMKDLTKEQQEFFTTKISFQARRVADG